MEAVRSVIAVLAGLAGAMLMVVALTWLVVQVMLGGDMTAEPTVPYLAVNLVYSFGAAVFGGWLTAIIAARRPILHAGFVAIAMMVLALSGDANPPEAGVPGWYYPIIGILGAAGALTGGWIRSRSEVARLLG